MLFNSIEFAYFLPIVFGLYWFVANRNLRLQNFLLVISSYFFYGWWDWRFLFLIFFSTCVDYFVGLSLGQAREEKRRKFLLWVSLLVNLGLLGLFKYYNFFAESFADAFQLFGHSFEVARLNFILPIGISFYTFQTLSYSIDIYRRKLEPTKDFISFAAFVSFFPQLVAGPIERATNLLPQFSKERKFEYERAVDGMRQILWGLVKKVIIADNCAEYANIIFNNSADYSGSTLLLGAFFFTLQIYGDFSGYSDIAIGTARLFGFNLMQNFAFPYFSRDIAEFWRRWHISLSTWFRDYLYIPLGGSRGGKLITVRNTFIIFIVSGFWHGANWTFIIWGALNAIYFLPLLLMKRNRRNLDTVAENRLLPTLRESFGMVTTFILTIFAWIFFRAESVTHAFSYIANIFTSEIIYKPYILESHIIESRTPDKILLLVGLFLLVEWIGRKHQFALALNFKNTFLNKAFRWSVYLVLVVLIKEFSGRPQEFIYFQF